MTHNGTTRAAPVGYVAGMMKGVNTKAVAAKMPLSTLHPGPAQQIR